MDPDIIMVGFTLEELRLIRSAVEAFEHDGITHGDVLRVLGETFRQIEHNS